MPILEVTEATAYAEERAAESKRQSAARTAVKCVLKGKNLPIDAVLSALADKQIKESDARAAILDLLSAKKVRLNRDRTLSLRT